MNIGIIKSNGYFTQHWINYCNTKGYNIIVLNPNENNIISSLKTCDFIFWHHLHGSHQDNLMAKQLLFSIQQSNIKVFPNFNTNWHFDDKIGQKYLLEAIEAPFVPTYVFYSKNEAIDWINNTSLPKVFKLKGGAGSANVKLVKDKRQAKRLISRAFGRGFPAFDRIGYFKERFSKFINGKDSIIGVLKGIGRLFIPLPEINLFHREKGYVYFQEFLPENDSDIRVIVIGDNAFAIKRLVRKNDFRASGSGTIIHSKDEIDIRCVLIAFETSQKLKAQCLAYDFIFDRANNPLIIEISYGFSPSGYVECPGYWDSSLKWHEGDFNPYGWMVDMVIEQKFQ